MKSLILTLLFYFCTMCVPIQRDGTQVAFINNSDTKIKFTLPGDLWDCDIKDIDADTTMASYYENVWSSRVDPHQSTLNYNNGESFQDWIPRNIGFYSMFIFSANGSDYSDEEKAYFDNDMYYQRYDLTLEDIRSLSNSSGVLVISYPPDERMKNVRMWPRYGNQAR